MTIGKATQADAINMFGKPQIKEIDDKGIDHWVYEFASPEESTSEGQWEKLELLFEEGILKDTILTINNGIIKDQPAI